MKVKRDSGQDVKHDCGCINKIGGEIVYCALHAAAPELLEAARYALKGYSGGAFQIGEIDVMLLKLEQAIAKAIRGKL